MWGAIIGGVVGIFRGIFGLKQRQADVVTAAIKVVGEVNDADAREQEARSKIITAEASSGYFLAAVWRPILMIFFASLIGARWFGYIPPNMTEAELMEVYGLVKLGVGGYIGGRTLEKVVTGLGLGKMLKTFVQKKLL